MKTALFVLILAFFSALSAAEVSQDTVDRLNRELPKLMAKVAAFEEAKKSAPNDQVADAYDRALKAARKDMGELEERLGKRINAVQKTADDATTIATGADNKATKLEGRVSALEKRADATDQNIKDVAQEIKAMKEAGSGQQPGSQQPTQQQGQQIVVAAMPVVHPIRVIYADPCPPQQVVYHTSYNPGYYQGGGYNHCRPIQYYPQRPSCYSQGRGYGGYPYRGGGGNSFNWGVGLGGRVKF